MSSNEQVDFDALEARSTDPDHPLGSADQVKSGADPAAGGHAFLLREYGADEAIAEAIRPRTATRW